MRTALLPKSRKVDPVLREEWLNTVQALEDQITDWVGQEPGWSVESEETADVFEAPLGTYTAPMLTIDTPDGQLRVEPIARNFPGAGIVEFYAWPTLNRVRLLQGSESASWRVLTDSGIFLKQDQSREELMAWNRGNFIGLAKDLLGAE